jgi:hypothetical protein
MRASGPGAVSTFEADFVTIPNFAATVAMAMTVAKNAIRLLIFRNEEIAFS